MCLFNVMVQSTTRYIIASAAVRCNSETQILQLSLRRFSSSPARGGVVAVSADEVAAVPHRSAVRLSLTVTLPKIISPHLFRIPEYDHVRPQDAEEVCTATRTRAKIWLRYYFPSLNVRKIESTRRLQVDVARANTFICSRQEKISHSCG